MRELLVIVQYCCIAVFFVESWIIFRRLEKPIHAFLLLSCITALINNIGYLLQMRAQTYEGTLNAIKFAYLGKSFYAFFLFMFVLELVNVKLPKAVKPILMIFHIIVYDFVLDLEYHDVYYKNIKYVTDGMFGRLEHDNGFLHHAFMGVQVVYIVIGLALLFNACIQEKSRKVKKRLISVICAFFIESLFFVLYLVGVPGVTENFDITTIGYFIGTIIMFVSIVSFDLLGTTDLAKEFVIEKISEAIIAVDDEGTIRYYNEPALQLFPELDPKKELFTEVLVEDDDNKEKKRSGNQVLSLIRRSIKDDESISVNGRIYQPNENILMKNRKSFGTVYALIDVTEHQRYMEELEKQKSIADKANVAKSRFLANMSHEIRTPINAVLGMDEMILRESQEDHTRSYASDIMSAGKTLLSLINDILDFSKIEEGKIQIIPVQYELSSIVNDLVNMIKDRATKKNLELKVNVDEHIPHMLIGDEIRIRQCVMNVLTNAVKYTEKGSVTLSVSYSATEEENAADRGIMLKFSVSDTGIGMRREEMEKLFSPYERIEEKRNRTIEGTGLGMSITRQLLELMGSHLEVRTEYGKGSTFEFAVRQEVASWNEIGDYSGRYADNEAGEGYAYHELFHAPKAKILVVDDTEINLTVICGLLKKTRICIDTAASGEEALTLTAANKYDLVFIDHMMPYMDGIETLNAMRESGKNIATPAVALTANAVSGAREMYLAAGFTEYLSKPVDGTKLEKMLMELLPKNKVITDGSDAEEDAEDEENAASDETENAEAELPKQVKAIRELDVETGLKNCGSVEGYISVLKVFHQTAAAKGAEIWDLYNDNDIANYTIKVHALKSSARIIGAKELSSLAEKLEKAGKEDDIPFIDENTDKLLGMYSAVDRELSVLDEKQKVLPKLEPAALKEAFDTVLEVAQTMDYGLMDELLKSLREYQLDPETDRRISRIEKMLTELDWDGIVLAVKE